MKSLINLPEIQSTRIKSDIIVNELNKINKNYTILTVSMNIYNVLTSHRYFFPTHLQEVDTVTEVGFLGNYKVFLDISLQEDLVIVSCDIKEKRDDKISSILEGKQTKKDLRIKVLNC